MAKQADAWPYCRSQAQEQPDDHHQLEGGRPLEHQQN